MTVTPTPYIQGAKTHSGGDVLSFAFSGQPVIGLDILEQGNGSLPVRSASGLSFGCYLVTTTNYCHIALGDNTVAATSSDTMLAPGERCIIVPEGEYVSVVGVGSSAADDVGIIRLTQLR